MKRFNEILETRPDKTDTTYSQLHLIARTFPCAVQTRCNANRETMPADTPSSSATAFIQRSRYSPLFFKGTATLQSLKALRKESNKQHKE